MPFVRRLRINTKCTGIAFGCRTICLCQEKLARDSMMGEEGLQVDMVRFRADLAKFKARSLLSTSKHIPENETKLKVSCGDLNFIRVCNDSFYRAQLFPASFRAQGPH